MKRFLLCLLIIPPAIGIYAHWIEPIWIQVTHHTVHANVKSSLKIAHLTDLHIREFGVREKRLLTLLKDEAPDAILISGDSVSDTGNYDAVGQFLKKLTAPKGVWLVRGNWEHWRPGENELKVYSEAKVHFLDNANHELAEGIWIIGVDDELAGHPKLGLASAEVPQGAYKIGLFHSPEFFVNHANAFDLVLAGHTHGGQVRIPFLRPFWLPKGSGPYVDGWYASQGEASKMYVSRGIGNSILELRFFCRPELPIITISPRT